MRGALVETCVSNLFVKSLNVVRSDIKNKMAKRQRAAQRSNRQPQTLEEFGKALMQGCCEKPVKRVMTPVNTHRATQVDRIEIDGFALDVLEMTMPEWVPNKLQEKMKESLRGFSEWAALWIAESLTDCCRGDALATTGIKHIDDLLWRLYSEILNCARERGVMIANHR